MAFKDYWTPWDDKYADLRRKLGEAVTKQEEFPGLETLPDNSDEAVGVWCAMHRLYEMYQMCK